MRHLRPTAPIARAAVLPGDPKRAMDLAIAALTKPRMSNLSRGLWGYHGRDSSGRELTVQSTGIGGPSAAVVVAELADLGVRQAIRVGTCVGLDPELEPGATVVVGEAIAGDGAGSRLAGGRPLVADRELTGALARATTGAEPRRTASTDIYHDPAAGTRTTWIRAGAVAVDLSAAAVLATSERAGIDAAVALVVAETADGERLEHEALDGAALALGQRAAGVLLACAQPEESAA